MTQKLDIDRLLAEIDAALAASETVVSAELARQSELKEKRARYLVTKETLTELGAEEYFVAAKRPGGPGRPKGATAAYKSRSDGPTIPEMIIEAIKDAMTRGRTKLRPLEIQGYLDHKWPGKVRPNAASAVCWKMGSDGRLINIGGAYALPPEKNEEANGAAPNLRH